MKKILLIGDSIRIGYDKYVKMAFDGIAEVYYPEENCRFSIYVLRGLLDWKNALGCGDDVDVVHWNAGLWDDLLMPDGEPLVHLDVYKVYIDRICRMIKKLFPKAKMIFATSTPIQEEPDVMYRRYNEDTEKYNAAAMEIVKSYGGQINDLYALAKAAPMEWHSDLVHYYTREGTQMLADPVIQHLEQALGIQAKTLDYDALFIDTTEIVGT